MTKCPDCLGSGKLEAITYHRFGRGPEPCGEEVECELCEGQGTLPEEDDPDA
tara:strand:+ start:512 stop:667 length:156 start_codon:yes stop_codon:yes gene_type:complete